MDGTHHSWRAQCGRSPFATRRSGAGTTRLVCHEHREIERMSACVSTHVCSSVSPQLVQNVLGRRDGRVVEDERVARELVLGCEQRLHTVDAVRISISPPRSGQAHIQQPKRRGTEQSTHRLASGRCKFTRNDTGSGSCSSAMSASSSASSATAFVSFCGAIASDHKRMLSE